MRKTNHKGCALPHFRFEVNPSVVFVDHHRVCNGQALPGSLADFFGSEKGIEDSGLHVFRNSRARILDSDLDALLAIPRLHFDFSFSAAAFCDDVANGVRGIDDQVENDLVEFAGQAGDQR